MIYIREAIPQDSEALQRLQAQAPQGKSLVVSTVNIPDFFSRARAYESWKVFNACENDSIIGSAACAIRDAVIGPVIQPVGYEFQYFTSPGHRRRGIARSLHQRIESYLSSRGVALSYALVMEGNVASMRFLEREGFRLHRKLVMPAIAVIKEIPVRGGDNIRPATPCDLEAVAELLNQTWRGHDLFEPASASSLTRQFERIVTLNHNDMLVREEDGTIVACAALWDWSKITRLTVLRPSLKMRVVGKLLVLARILPTFPGPGDTLRQMMLTTIGYRSPADLAPLVKQANNRALREGVEQLFCISERNDGILESVKGFTRINTGMNLYVKALRAGISMTDAPVAMTGFDM